MVVINALVYKEDGRFYVEDYEFALLADGRTREEAKKLYLEVLDSQLETTRAHRANLLAADKASERCRKGLEKIFSTERDIKPDIKKMRHISIHFYNELID